MLSEFLPATLRTHGSLTLVRAGLPPYTEAFLDQTLGRLRETAPTLTVSTSELLGMQPSTPAPALIAHCGRSGSTLLCRMLDEIGLFATFREPDILVDAFRSAPLRGADGLTTAVLGQMAWAAHSANRLPVVKLQSHALDVLDALAFSAPAGPVILLRHPVPVVRKLLKKPPLWLMREVAAHGLTGPAGRDTTLEATPVIVEYLAHVWTSRVRAAERLAARSLVISYDQLVRDPGQTVARCARHLAGVQADTARVRSIAGRDSKSGLPWVGGDPGPALGGKCLELVLSVSANELRTAAELCGGPLNT